MKQTGILCEHSNVTFSFFFLVNIQYGDLRLKWYVFKSARINSDQQVKNLLGITEFVNDMITKETNRFRLGLFLFVFLFFFIAS